MDKPVSVKTFPLFFQVDNEHKINSFFNTRKPNWNLFEEKEPCFLWQPNVKPNKHGGTIISKENQTEKSSHFQNLVSKQSEPNPNQQDWILKTGEGSTFTLRCQESSEHKSVILTQIAGDENNEARFIIQNVEDDFTLTRNMPTKVYEESEEAIKNDQIEKEKFNKYIEEEKNKRTKGIKEKMKDYLDPLDPNFDEEEHYESEQADITEENSEYDDKEVEDIESELSEQKRMYEFLWDSSTSEEYTEEEEKKEKNITKYKGGEVSDDQVISKFVNKMRGHKYISEEEFVRFFLVNPRVTFKQLRARFENEIKDTLVKKALGKLIIKKCKMIDRDGVPFLQLKGVKI